MRKLQKSPWTALYTHIPKAAGSSIATAPFVTKHGSYRDFSTRVTKEGMPELKKSFSFVRNPLTRFTSAVFNHDYCKPEEFYEWVTTVFLPDHRIAFEKREWAELQPQKDLLYFDGKLDVDFVGRFENLERDWEFFCGMIGEKYKLPHENKNRFPDHAKSMTPEIEKILRKVYAEDFEIFDY